MNYEQLKKSDFALILIVKFATDKKSYSQASFSGSFGEPWPPRAFSAEPWPPVCLRADAGDNSRVAS